MVLPLLERLVRVLRARRPQRSEERAVGPPQHPAASIPSPVLIPPALPPRYPAAERLSTGERVRVRRMSQQATAAEPMRGVNLSSRARHAFSLSKSADLRGAMMLLAILGPCKALDGEPGSVPGRQT